MKQRRTKRIRGLILALATAAVLAPAASGHVYFGSTSHADYSGLTPQALQAMNERWTKLAASYQQVRPDDRGGVRGVQQSLDTASTQSVRADDRGGIRGVGPTETPLVASSHSDTFDWADAGIGASITLFAAGMLAAAALARRRRTGLAV